MARTARTKKIVDRTDLIVSTTTQAPARQALLTLDTRVDNGVVQGWTTACEGDCDTRFWISARQLTPADFSDLSKGYHEVVFTAPRAMVCTNCR
jgi:hypothetical protein